MRAAFLFFVIATVLTVVVIEAAAHVATHRQDFPWTKLDLDDPTGDATAGKLARLRGDPARCRQLLADIGDADRPAPPLRVSGDCGYADGMRLLPEDAGSVRFQPPGAVTSCPVAAALVLWERDVVEPAAAKHFGEPVSVIVHAGSYSCRRLYGRAEGRYSEHATANAFDVLGFRLADGRPVSVLSHWRGTGVEARFLKDVRDGACRLFATVLSPDYNAAHVDHLHFDQARRGMSGWQMCR